MLNHYAIPALFRLENENSEPQMWDKHGHVVISAGYLSRVPDLVNETANSPGWRSNGPFALTGHMVQNPPYWMAKECSRFKHKGIPACQA